MPDPPPYIARISLRDRFLGTGVFVAARLAWSIDIAEGHQCNAFGYHGGEYDAVPASVRSAQRQRVDLNQSLIEGCSGGALVMGKGSGKHLTLPSFRIGRFLVTVWEYGKYLDDTRAPKPPARSHLPRARLGGCS